MYEASARSKHGSSPPVIVLELRAFKHHINKRILEHNMVLIVQNLLQYGIVQNKTLIRKAVQSLQSSSTGPSGWSEGLEVGT